MSEENQFDRSPRSPRVPLVDAVETAKKLYTKVGRSVIKPDSAAAALDYKGMNGAALGTLGTLSGYGLINRSNGQVSITPLALKLFHPTDDKQLADAKKEAALTPKIFKEIWENYHDLSEDILANTLIHKNFTPEGAKRAASVYKANSTFAILDKNGTVQQEIPIKPDAAAAKSEPFISDKISIKPPMPSTNIAELPVPIGDNMIARVPFPMTEEDFDLFIGTLNLWKKKLTKAPSFAVPKSTFPATAIWYNDNADHPVIVEGEMGSKDGVTYYRVQGSDAGIPANQIRFVNQTS